MGSCSKRYAREPSGNKEGHRSCDNGPLHSNGQACGTCSSSSSRPPGSSCQSCRSLTRGNACLSRRLNCCPLQHLLSENVKTDPALEIENIVSPNNNIFQTYCMLLRSANAAMLFRANSFVTVWRPVRPKTYWRSLVLLRSFVVDSCRTEFVLASGVSSFLPRRNFFMVLTTALMMSIFPP
jgi:hypothetical protein